MIKRCLKSRIFWLLMSISVLGIAYYYGEISSYYDEYAELLIITLFMVFNVLCLVNLSRKNGIKRLLTITIISFAVSLFLFVAFHEDLLYSDIWGMISLISLLFIFIPAGTLVLLKLVWRDKLDDVGNNEDKKIVKKTRRKINKK